MVVEVASQITMKEKTPFLYEVVCFQMLDFETLKSNLEVYVSSEGAVSYIVLYHQQLPITRE